MRNTVPELPLFKEFTSFIYNNHLHEFIQEVSNNYQDLDVPLLKLYKAKDQLEEIFSNSLTRLLEQYASGYAIQAAQQNVDAWKADKIPGIHREDVTASDLLLINNARKTAFLKFIQKFSGTERDNYPLLKEIEDFYTFSTGLSIHAFAEIKQEEVLQREMRLKEAQALAKLGNWEYNTASGRVKWSDGLYGIYGIDPATILDVSTISNYIFKEDFPRVQQAVRGSAGSEENYTIEYRVRRPDGLIVHLLENGYSERNSENQLIYRGTTQDITALKNAEFYLREKEINFRMLAENSTDIISKHALDSNILYISPSIFPITGYTPEELMGKKALEFYHPEDLPDMQESFQEVVAIPDSHLVSFRFRKKDGNYIWFESIGKTLRDEQGNPIEIIASNRDDTARKESEIRLRKNEALLNGVLNSSISGIQLFRSIRNEQGKIIDFEWILANDSILKLWGKTREEVIGYRMLSLFPGLISSGIFDKYVLAAEGETQSFKQHYGSEGLNHWFYIFARKFDDGFLLSTDDITAQVLAEQELISINQELEEKVRLRTAELEKQKENIYSVLMQAPAMIAITRGPDLTFELANPLYLNGVGRTKEIIGMPLLEAFPEIRNQPIHEIIQNVYLKGERYIGNEVLIPLDINNDGQAENIYFNFVYEPLLNTNGIVDGVLIHAVEVTSQVEAKLKLQESEDRFRSMADNIPNLAWMADADGNVFWYNKRWYEYTGTTKEQMKGWGWEAVMHPEELNLVKDRWIKSLHTGDFFEMVFPIKGADNIFRSFLTRVSPITNQEGKIVRWFGTNTDITERIKAEEALEKQNSELLKINNDLDNFIYTASHDLKAPVANIEGLINTMEDTLSEESKHSEDVKYIFGLIKKSIDLFKQTILDLTEVSKAQKLMAEDVAEISILEMADNVRLAISNQIAESNADIRVDISNNEKLKFSRKNFHSILYNLLSNAIKYRDTKRSLVVLISTKREDGYFVLTIQDNGLGVSESNKAKMFTMFKRFHNHVEGSGIGLYIIKRMIDNAGGKIEVESELGKGSTFRVYLK